MNDAIKERSILFSAPMVRAILSNTKTQTRRVWKLPNWLTWDESAGGESKGNLIPKDPALNGWYSPDEVACPYVQVDDRLWVRETFATLSNGDFLPVKPSSGLSQDVRYRADDPLRDSSANIRGYGWRPSIFMPRWASRINLEITGVSVERLQDISDDDAKAEGIQPTPGRDIVDRWLIKNPKGSLSEYSSTQYPVDAYKSLWESINGPESWAANPWVWVIEFKKL